MEAFASIKLVPWSLRNRWRNCLYLVSKMSFHVSHIYREGNACVDSLASKGFVIRNFFWWNHLPSFISDDYHKNRFGLPNYRFI